MAAMSNQAYLSVWFKDFSESRMLEQFGTFLTTVPFSKTKPGFTFLVIRAVDASETPLLEQDLRSVPLDAAGIIELAKDHLHSDTCYEVRSTWDLWVYEGDPARWQSAPQPIEILCNGEDYDDGFWRENGHIEVNFGFEHLFTGHAQLLGIRKNTNPVPHSPEEAQFLASMAQPANLQMYQEKTRENIRRMFDWVRKIEQSLEIEKLRLWSEGEENFEARIEEVVAAR
jgi:hypothetical protein